MGGELGHHRGAVAQALERASSATNAKETVDGPASRSRLDSASWQAHTVGLCGLALLFFASLLVAKTPTKGHKEPLP